MARASGGSVALSRTVARPHRPADHRPARSAHRRRHPRGRDLCRPLRVRRQDRHLPRPLDLRSRTAVGRLGGGAARFRLAAAFARGGYRADPRQRPLAGRRLDIAIRPSKRPVGRRADVLARRVISLLSQAPLVLGDTDGKFYRRYLRGLAREIRHLRYAMLDIARRRAAAAGADRAVLRRRSASPTRPAISAPRRASCPTNCSARSCPTAATSRAIPAR